MTIHTLSPVRFTTTKNGDWRGEATITLADGTTAYPRLTGRALNALLQAHKDAGGTITGATRTGVKDGVPFSIVEYRTDMMGFTATLEGGRLDNPTGIELVGAYGDKATIAALVQGVATPVTAVRARAAISDSSAAAPDEYGA